MSKWIIYRVSAWNRLVKVGFVNACNSPDALLKAFDAFPSVLDPSKFQNGLVARKHIPKKGR